MGGSSRSGFRGYEMRVTFLRFETLKNIKSPFSGALLGYFSKWPSESAYIRQVIILNGLNFSPQIQGGKVDKVVDK